MLVSWRERGETAERGRHAAIVAALRTRGLSATVVPHPMPPRMPRLLYLFSLCNLVMGTGAFVLSGILAPMSSSLHVSVATAGIAVAMVEPAQRGRALALVFLGISLSYVIGVPLGAWLGFRFGWQWPIALVAAAALASSLALWRLLPRHIAAPGASFKSLPGLLAQARVLWTLSLTLLYFIAIFMVFSFIGPVLQALVPMSGERISLTLMLFGVSGVLGTMIGGSATTASARAARLSSSSACSARRCCWCR